MKSYRKKGYNVHTLFTISEVVEILKEEKKKQLTDDEVERINDFLNGNTVTFEEKKKFVTKKNLKI